MTDAEPFDIEWAVVSVGVMGLADRAAVARLLHQLARQDGSPHRIPSAFLIDVDSPIPLLPLGR
jgi:hypothetical protein